MSVIIKNENRWIGHYLDYYLTCMDVQHVFVYDNFTENETELREILRPYAKRGQVTYLPWHFRWRNRLDHKQIGQPPQQSHTLERFGATRWIGFFDVDEFLRIPDKTLPQFLSEYDPNQVDGLSFGLRWFMHQGDLTFDEIEDPLLSFLHCKRDELGRKRQKLMVSARNVRFLRFHWLEEGKRELEIDDENIFFHHYYLRRPRFEEGKTETGTTYDDHMLRFAESQGTTPPKPLLSRRFPKKPKPQSTLEWIAHVEESLRRADARESNLTRDILDVKGMCGTKNRHFFNNLCNFEGCTYLEIGSWNGASLVAAMQGNDLSATAIDNWSGFGGPREAFMVRPKRFQGG